MSPTRREMHLGVFVAAARGHWVHCGTPNRIADTPEEWFAGPRQGGAARVCDGP